MENSESHILVVIPKEAWEDVRAAQQSILEQLKELHHQSLPGVPIKYITAKEFMEAARIKRTKFDQLVNTSKIKIIKKRRKIYVPITEVDRYFNDPSIQ